jgi:hypothetical protein
MFSKSNNAILAQLLERTRKCPPISRKDCVLDTLRDEPGGPSRCLDPTSPELQGHTAEKCAALLSTAEWQAPR